MLSSTPYMPLTREEIAQLPSQISIVSSRTKQSVRFTINNEISPNQNVTDGTLRLQLQDTPKEDLIVRLVASNGLEKAISFQYVEKLNLTVTSEDDPSIVEYIATWSQGIYKTHYVAPGKRYTYHFDFSHPMDRSGFESKLKRMYPGGMPSEAAWTWENDRRVNLTLDYTQASAKAYTFELYGIQAQNRTVFAGIGTLRIEPSPPQALYRIDIPTRKKDRLFVPGIHFHRLESIAPGGNYAMAVEDGSNEMRGLDGYSVIEMNGRTVASYGMDRVRAHYWNAEGTALLFWKDDQVLVDDLKSGTTKVIWTPPAAGSNSRIVSLDADESWSRIIIGWGTHDENGKFTYDLHVLTGVEDTLPFVIPSAGSFSCYEGPCLAHGVRTIIGSSLDLQVDSGSGLSTTRFDLATGARQELGTTPRIAPQGGAVSRSIRLENGQILLLEKLASSETAERWVMFDPQTNQYTALMETSLGLIRNWDPLLELGNSQFLVRQANRSWSIVDTNSKQVSPFELIPKDVDQVTKLDHALYFFGDAN